MRGFFKFFFIIIHVFRVFRVVNFSAGVSPISPSSMRKPSQGRGMPLSDCVTMVGDTKMGNLQITSPQPVALLRDYLWQLAVLAMSIPSRSTLFE
jgi:hypothetical protein